MIEIGHFSHAGSNRNLNEDTFEIDSRNQFAFVVDGMGGQNLGDIASAFVREQLRKQLLLNTPMHEALMDIGQSLRIQRPQQSHSPSGASAIIAQWQNSEILLTWLGTCRGYYFDGENTEHVVDEHTKKESRATENSATSIQALGITAPDRLSIQSKRVGFKKQQSILLGSDGFFEACSASKIHAVLQQGALSAQECVDQLCLDILLAGAQNNLSAIVLKRH